MTPAEMYVPVRVARAARHVIGNEGAWSDHPADGGGRTHYGITEAVARRHGLEIEAVTHTDAVRIYYTDYWRWDWVRHDRVATKLLDIAVNSGVRTAVIVLQRALAGLGHHDLAEDGIAGPLTKAACNARREAPMVAALSIAQGQRYFDLVRAKPGQVVFIDGWVTRAAKPVA